MQVHTKFNGELSFQVWSADSLDKDGSPLPGAKPKQETPFQPQIITDAFFETWLDGTTATRADLFAYCAVGNGATAATAADTTISQIGTRFPIFSGDYLYSSTGSTITQTTGFRTTQGQIIGIISEVGLFKDPTGGQTMMRSLIKDGGGAATTLSLGAMDFLYVRWRVTTTINLSDVTGTVSIGGVSYNYALRPSFWNTLPGTGTTSAYPFIPVSPSNQVNGYLGFNSCQAYATQTLGSVTSQPSGGYFNGVPISTNTYTASSKQRKMTYKWDITQGNTGSGIGSIKVYNSTSGVGYQISFAATSGGATIPKDNTKEFTIGITFSFGR